MAVQPELRNVVVAGLWLSCALGLPEFHSQGVRCVLDTGQLTPEVVIRVDLNLGIGVPFPGVLEWLYVSVTFHVRFYV